MDTLIQIVFVALGVATLATTVLAIEEWGALGGHDDRAGGSL
ncbi:hypothetical protein M2194_004950 [Bradyrhizobium elkanii]|nr:hypothetical protein [Bradyrhizobium elkanii]